MPVRSIALGRSLPPSYLLHVLDEKHVLKRAAAGLVPPAIIARKKQPYRAPDALSFLGEGAPGWIAEALSASAVERVGVFDPRAVEALYRKCRASAGGQFSNADNMAFVTCDSIGLIHL